MRRYRSAYRRRWLASEASAACDAAALQVGGAGHYLRAAITEANPSGVPPFHMRKEHCHKTTETLPRDVCWQTADTTPIVVRLLNARPTAIAGFVSEIVVDPVKQHTRRRFAHVLKKCLEAVLPSVAHGDAATTVVLEPPVLGVQATLLHRCPAFEGGRAPPSMCSDAGAQLFTMKTAATDRQASGHVSHRNVFLSPAIASATPNGAMELVPTRKTKRDQSPKTFSGDILESGHNGSDEERLCQEAARRFSSGPSRVSTIFCRRLQ